MVYAKEEVVLRGRAEGVRHDHRGSLRLQRGLRQMGGQVVEREEGLVLQERAEGVLPRGQLNYCYYYDRWGNANYNHRRVLRLQGRFGQFREGMVCPEEAVVLREEGGRVRHVDHEPAVRLPRRAQEVGVGLVSPEEDVVLQEREQGLFHIDDQ